MSLLGERLRERWDALRVRVVVEEWRELLPADSRGEPAIYASPFTLADTRSLSKWIKEDSPEGFAMVLITKAETEDGERLFDIGDRKTLLESCEASVINRVGTEIMASVTLEDAEGN